MRSKALLATNILSTLYSAILIVIFGGAVIAAGGFAYIEDLYEYFEMIYDIFGTSVGWGVLSATLILLCVHIGLFALGTILNWIAFASKKSGLARLSAAFFLIGTIIFPIFILLDLPIIILGFVGASKQKKINITCEQS